MRIINLENGIDIPYESFSLNIQINNEFVDIIAYNLYTLDYKVLCTVNKLEHAARILKSIALAYYNGTKVYFIEL